ncbi:hypothetical protein MD484_g6042, partial [Candolleomyces efflorescens]
MSYSKGNSGLDLEFKTYRSDPCHVNDEVQSPNTPIDAHYDPKFVSSTLQKIDWRMLPLLGLIASIALIDRANLGVARISGMESDLVRILGDSPTPCIASMIFFPTYVLLEVPGNLILRWLGARCWITICVVGWGAAQVGMAFVPHWGFLCLTRALLGLFEAGYFPAMAFIITTWYKREEVQKRLAAFFLLAYGLAGFGPLLAYAIQLLGDSAGLRGWRWIFLVEGLVTIVLGILSWLYVPDLPSRNTFLTPVETQMVLDRIEADRQDSLPDPITGEKVLEHLCDPLIWLCGELKLFMLPSSSRADTFYYGSALMYLGCMMAIYAMAFFLPVLLRGMGFDRRDSLLLSTPPYLVAVISGFFFAWLADKTKKRALWVFVQTLITIAGTMITAYGQLNGVRYFGLFLVKMGASGSIPGVWAYASLSIIILQRAVSTAVIVAFGGVGGIFSTLVFRQKDHPNYIPGIWAIMACQFMIITLLAINTWIFHRRNKLAAEGKRINEGTPGFFYTL